MKKSNRRTGLKDGRGSRNTDVRKDSSSSHKKSSDKGKEGFQIVRGDDMGTRGREDSGHTGNFRVRVGGREKNYKIETGYGYFIHSFRKATNLSEIVRSVDKELSSKEIKPIIEYLDFKVPEIAKAAAVSVSTVSRWNPATLIGIPGSSQFFKIDEVIRKGVGLFGGEEEFKTWLTSPNTALGNVMPADLLISAIGIEMVDEALDALHFGTML